jgi:replicative DNA helicase
MSLEAEVSIIGSILKSPESYDLLPTSLHHTDFFSEAHRIIFQTIRAMMDAGKQVDTIVLGEALEARQLLERVGGMLYLGEIVQSTYTYKNIVHHAEIVHKEAVRRNLERTANEITDMCKSKQDPIESAMEAEKKIIDILDNKAREDYVHIGVAFDEFVEWEKSDNKTIKTGLQNIDGITGGFADGNLIILAARPSVGKTSLAMQMAEKAAMEGTVMVFSIEMNRREIAGRISKYRRSVLGWDEERVKMHIYGMKMHIDATSGINVGHVRTVCRRVKRKHGLAMIVIDYLQLMKGEGDNRTQEIGSISRGLKSVAKEFDVPVMVLSQLNRKSADRADRRPIMSDLRDSGEIEQDADMILFIHREDDPNKDAAAKGIVEVICSKNRNGATGTAKLTFNGELTRFSDYEGGDIRGNSYRKAKEGDDDCY